MRNLFYLIPFLFVLAISAGAQTVSRTPVSEPFTIDKGTSFSASPGGRITSTSNTTPPVALQITSDVLEALDVIRNNHVGGKNLDPRAVVKSSISSMLAELDPHSVYFDAAEFTELLGEHESEYSGTGSTISNFVKNGRIETYVLATQPGSAAAKADLHYGDRIIAVNGERVVGLTIDVVRDKIRGPRGTVVRLTVEKAVTGKTETVEMRRERVSQPSITNYSVLRDGVGYIALSNGFTHTTTNELNVAMSELYRRGMTSLILDLRSNSGGILDQAIEVAEKFLPAGRAIILQRGRYKSEERLWTSRNRKPEKVPLVVLVDEHTASASEVVAGALQDNDRALIVGQRTFGKGLVQNVVQLPMGSGLTITTARYFTPSGRSIQRHYEGSGRYDYFMNRSAEEKSGIATRTISNRPVHSDSGIAPDVVTETEAYNAGRAALIDPIFFFVRELISEKVRGKHATEVSSKDNIRQSIIFGTDPMPSDTVARFRDFVRKGPWHVSSALLDREVSFIQRQLRYQLTLAAFGPDSAELVLVASDNQISQAINALPQASILAKAAARIRIHGKDKKARRVAFPAGQGRNRRN
ncbi:MAG TPA: S41 family peptidase [Pyrinomonadaceae bacterium]